MHTLTVQAPHTFRFGHHIDEDALECYALGRIQDENPLAPIEEHLLVCNECQDRLQRKEAFVRLIRAALERIE